MGNGSAKRTNQMLGEQKNRTADIYTNPMARYGAEDRNYSTSSRDFLTEQYKNLLSTVGQPRPGGGGGPAFKPRENEALGTYREFMNNGGFSPEQTRDFRLRSSGVIPSIFEGVRRQMQEAANIRGGGYAGYSGQLAKLAREKAQEAEAGRLGSEVELQNMIREGRQFGAEGVKELSEKAEAARRQAHRARAAGASRGADDAFRQQMAILGELRGLRGESGTDLGYFDRVGNGLGMESGAINSRVNEPGMLQQVGGALGGLAGAVMPFANMLPKGNKPSYMPTESFG